MANSKTTGGSGEIKKLAKTQKLVIGAKTTMKGLRDGRISKIYLAANTKDSTKKDFEKYAKIAGVDVVELSVKNDELGILCRKPFSISVLGELK